MSKLVNPIKLEFIKSEDEPNRFNSSIQDNQTSTECSPLFNQSNQYWATIEGVKYPKSLMLSKNQSINFECLNKNNKTKVILFWNPFFGDYTYGFGLGRFQPFIDDKCPVTNCELTKDRSRINESDLVITHMRDKIDDPPRFRPDHQRWVFMLYESPVHAADLTNYNGFYNLDSTYRLNSDFPGNYEQMNGMSWQKNPQFNTQVDFLSKKINFSAAIISNCNAQSNRMNYLKEMQNNIKIDIFGGCGRRCPTSYSNSTPGDCKAIIGSEYKFYFAFENSICKDYITEKFFVILKYEIIPVVLGGGQYDHYVRNFLNTGL